MTTLFRNAAEALPVTLESAAQSAILRVVENFLPNEVAPRMKALNEPATRRELFEGWRASVYEMCPRDIMAPLFEYALTDEGAQKVFLPYADLVTPNDGAEWVLLYSADFKCADFRLTHPERTTEKRRVLKPNEAYFAAEYMGYARPDIYLGVNLFKNAIHAFADSGLKWVEDGKRAAAPQSTRVMLEYLTPFFARVFVKIKTEVAYPSDTGTIASGLCVHARAQNPVDANILPTMPLNIPDSMHWLYEAGLFRKDNLCPGSVKVISLMTMPLFVGTSREAPALAHFIKKAGSLIAHDPFWRAKAQDISRVLRAYPLAPIDENKEAYGKTPSARAMARLRADLGDKPHLFVSPKPPLALG